MRIASTMTQGVIATATGEAQGGTHDKHRHHNHHPSPPTIDMHLEAYALADADRRDALVARAGMPTASCSIRRSRVTAVPRSALWPTSC